MDIRQCLEEEKDAFVSRVREQGAGKQIVIYGAGAYGQEMERLLKEHGLHASGFAVTKMGRNRRIVCGLPVRTLEELIPGQEQTLFLVAAKKGTQGSMEAALRASGARYYLLPPAHSAEILGEMFQRPFVEITAKAGCSVRCRYCPQDMLLHRYFSTSNPAEMTIDDFRRYLSRLPEGIQVVFSGFVEPFLAKDGVRMVRYAHDSGHVVRLFTTLVGLTLEAFHTIEDIPFRQVVLHLPDVHQYADIPVTDAYLELLRYIVEKKRPDGAPFVDNATCQAEPDPRVVEIIGNRFPITWNLIDRAGNLPAEELDHQEVPSMESKGIYYCNRTLHLDHNVLLPNGDLALCCMDFGMRHILGNLNEQSYEDIMNGETIKRIRRTLRAGAHGLLCEKCTSLKRF